MATGATVPDINSLLGFSAFFGAEDMTYAIPPFHKQIYADLDSGVKRLCIEAPRIGAKSTTCSKNFPLKEICTGDASCIIPISDTQALSEKILDWLRAKLESKWIQSAFGDGRTAKWTNSHFIWRRRNGTKCEVIAKGRGAQIRGYRPDIIICDDLENDELVRSQEQREKLLEWFNSALVNTLKSWQRLIFVGTPLHPQCLLWDVANRPGWLHRRYPAINPDGTALWPDQWSIEALERRKAEIGSRAFEMEFMLNPMVNENPIFFKEWFCEYDSRGFAFDEELSRGVYTVIAVDPAISQRQEADFTAIVTVSATLGPHPKYYVRVGGTKRDRLSLRSCVSELARIYQTFNANAAVIEIVAYQEALEQEFRAYMEEHRKFANIVPVKRTKDKVQRAWTIQPLLERGQVYFDHSDAMTKRLMEEMVNFPSGTHDDMVDGLIDALNQAQQWADSYYQQDAPVIVLPNRPNAYTGAV